MTERINLGGMTNTTVHIETDGTIHVEEKQDCQAILDSNQRKRDHRFDSWSPEGFVQEVAEIPEVEYLKMCRKIGQQPFSTPDIAMELILRDPEFAKCLTAPKLRDPRIRMRGAR
jgi:hypothetical protein